MSRRGRPRKKRGSDAKPHQQQEEKGEEKEAAGTETAEEEVAAAASPATELCKVGNPKCGLLIGESLASGSIGVMPCDICCSEPGFCRDCICILCGNTIPSSGSHGLHSFTSIRCFAKLSGAGFCGHAAHLACALECQMAGVVKQLGLDMEYICRRCDQKTDLREHVVHLLDSLRFVNSSKSVETNLGLALRIMHGTEQPGAKSLEHLIQRTIGMVQKGSSIREVYDLLHGTGSEFEDTEQGNT